MSFFPAPKEPLGEGGSLKLSLYSQLLTLSPAECPQTEKEPENHFFPFNFSVALAANWLVSGSLLGALEAPGSVSVPTSAGNSGVRGRGQLFLAGHQPMADWAHCRPSPLTGPSSLLMLHLGSTWAPGENLHFPTHHGHLCCYPTPAHPRWACWASILTPDPRTSDS